MKVIIQKDKCTGSGECVKVCPVNAISIINGKAEIDQEICDLDGICIPACPNSAIKLIDE